MFNKSKDEITSIENYETNYKGIMVQIERYANGKIKYLLMNDKDFDVKEFKKYPTEKQIENYRNKLLEIYESESVIYGY